MNKYLISSEEIINNKNIEDCIYTIRGQQVMLDSDIAFFFGIETKNLNKQMKRNIERFPEDFCFQLNSKEFKTLRFQNATFNSSTKGRKYIPYVYTEYGIIALAAVLKSEVADKMSVEIARKFIQMRKFILENGDNLLALARLQNRQLEFENETNRKFEQLFKLIERLDLPKTALFYAGEWYDAFEYISSLISSASHSILLIDPYCDGKALTFLSHRKDGVKITIVKGEYAKLNDEEIDIFESQYGSINLKLLDDIHDRYLIVDNDVCYSLGASLNYSGKKLFTVIKIEDKGIVRLLINKVDI